MIAADISGDFWATAAQVSAAMFLALVIEWRMPETRTVAMRGQVASPQQKTAWALAVITLGSMMLPLIVLLTGPGSAATWVAVCEMVLLGIEGLAILMLALNVRPR